ncbi:hypothetical protein RD792_017197 [Penstemon davidsonii]|uniref:Uncharacterized protein n=1 Tax=Penstemon davidsonii TaxID=160366 RepID=A0ABR0CM39_9LAMI|nr:hypothetical protein RD792_017197 [Penstemon davidsonii]
MCSFLNQPRSHQPSDQQSDHQRSTSTSRVKTVSAWLANIALLRPSCGDFGIFTFLLMNVIVGCSVSQFGINGTTWLAYGASVFLHGLRLILESLPLVFLYYSIAWLANIALLRPSCGDFGIFTFLLMNAIIGCTASQFGISGTTWLAYGACVFLHGVRLIVESLPLINYTLTFVGKKWTTYITHANAKSKSEKFPPPHQDGGLGYPLGSSHHIDPSFDPPDVPYSSMNFSYSKVPMQTWSGPLVDPAPRRKSKPSKKDHR